METYWKMMTQKRFELYCLSYQLNSYIQFERVLNIILAIISTGSLAGLVLNENMRFILSIILAFTQIITAAKPYLPFQDRCKELEKNLFIFEKLYLEIEEQWHVLSCENLDDKKIIKLAYEYEKKWTNIKSEVSKEDSFFISEKNRNKAEIDKQKYFINFNSGL